MNQLHAERLAGVVILLQTLQDSADSLRDLIGSGTAVEPSNLMRFSAVLRDAEPLFKQIGMEKSRRQVELVAGSRDHFRNQNVSAMSVEIRRIIETILTELSQRRFLYVSPDRDSYYENENLFGADVVCRFPLAKSDIAAAGNCLCAECHTAAVFHLMLAFEWALRTFCSKLGLKRLADWDKKKSQFKYTPASFAVWEKLLNQLPKRIEQRLNSLRPGPKRQRLQEYYSSALEDIKSVKDAWRNHVMHTRLTFGRDDALAVFSHVKSIMQRLANDETRTL